MPRSKEVIEKIQQESKEKILLAALHLFVKKGIQTSMQEIAKEAGVSKGLIFHYFTSKEILITEILDMGAKGSQAAMSEKLQQAMKPSEIISSISEMMVTALTSDDYTTSMFLFSVQLSISQPGPVIMQKLKESALPVNMLSQLIFAAQQEGIAKSGDPDQLALMYWAAVQGLCCFVLSGMKLKLEKEDLNHILLSEGIK